MTLPLSVVASTAGALRVGTSVEVAVGRGAAVGGRAVGIGVGVRLEVPVPPEQADKPRAMMRSAARCEGSIGASFHPLAGCLRSLGSRVKSSPKRQRAPIGARAVFIPPNVSERYFSGTGAAGAIFLILAIKRARTLASFSVTRRSRRVCTLTNRLRRRLY